VLFPNQIAVADYAATFELLYASQAQQKEDVQASAVRNTSVKVTKLTCVHIVQECACMETTRQTRICFLMLAVTYKERSKGLDAERSLRYA
jgi:hypothetical protein